MNTTMNNSSRDGYLIDVQNYETDNLEDLSPKERFEKRQFRKKKIVKACITGILVCVICAAIKFFIGYVNHSISVESDAMSSLTESYSYIISAVGITLAHKKPDKAHPNGYGRLEFLTVMIGSVLVIIAGWHYFEQSIQRIFSPELSTLSTLDFIIIGITILGKLYLFKDDGEVGKEINSAGLTTASKNALLSALTSVIVIIGAIFSQYFKIDIDGIVGVIIALLMLYTGISGLQKGIKPLLGSPIKLETAQAITKILLKYYPIIGVYDLRLNNNGANIIRGTVNCEVPENANAEEIYEAFRKARTEIYRKLGIDLTIGLMTVNYCDPEVFPKFNEIYNEVIKIDGIENVHGFNWNQENNEVDIHVLVDYKQLENQDLRDKIQDIVLKSIPDSKVLVEFNVNYLEEKQKTMPACAVPVKS